MRAARPGISAEKLPGRGGRRLRLHHHRHPARPERADGERLRGRRRAGHPHEAALGVQVDPQDAGAPLAQAIHQGAGRGGLAHAALLVGNSDDSGQAISSSKIFL